MHRQDPIVLQVMCIFRTLTNQLPTYSLVISIIYLYLYIYYFYLHVPKLVDVARCQVALSTCSFNS